MKVKVDKYAIKNYNSELEFNHYNEILDFDKFYKVFNLNDLGCTITLDNNKKLFIYKHEIKEMLK